MRFALCLLVVAVCGVPSYGADVKRPNIVFILADDLGYTDVGCNGSKYYETPNIDRMADEGIRFTDGYTCGPNCQPTRAALMSGQYAPRTGVYTVGGIDRFDWQSRPLRPVDNVTSLPLEKITIADTLKKAGYVTGMFGKWHLGRGEHHPSKRGFDEAIESSGVHYNFKTEPEVDYPKDQYLADFLTDRAVDFIEKHKDGPFFLYLPHYGVHAPYQAKEELVEKFKDKKPVGGHHDPTYAAMIASVDESVGRVLAKLEELGIAENTLVIFSSDNGGVGSYKSIGLDKDGITSNAPLKAGKGSLYDGGVRVPYVFYWKGRIKPRQENATPIISVDLYPTLAELAGAKLPADYSLDGVSYAAVLKGEKSDLDREDIYWHFPGYLGAAAGEWRTTPTGAIREGDWKLLERFEDGSVELYNLKDDLGQENNLAEKEPERAKQLQAKLAAWREGIGAKMPTKNDDVTKASDGKAKKSGKKNKKNRKGKKKRAKAEAAAAAE